jgi:hypothetical protein
VSQWWYDYGLLVLLLVVVIAIVCGVAWLVQAECSAVTRDIGFPHRWSFLGGCQIQVSDGKWLPLDNYREFNR